jgi:hypothetical protein
LWVRGCEQLGSLGGVSLAFIGAGWSSGTGARCIVVCGAPFGVPIDFVVRLARPSAAGSWPFPRPAVVLADPVSRGLTFADPTEGGTGAFVPGLRPLLAFVQDQSLLDTWSGLACSWAGCAIRVLPEGRSPDVFRPGHRRPPRIAPPTRRSWSRSPAGDLLGSLAGLLSWTSQRSPPSTSAVCVHSRRWVRSDSPRTGSTSRSLRMSQRALRSPGSRPVAFAPITFGPGMPLPESRSALAVSHDFGGFLRTRGAGLLHPAADHGVRLVSGSLRPFAPSVPEGLPGSFWKASAVSIPGDRQAGTRPPSGD